MTKRLYKQTLPFYEDAKVADQFGWLPLSIIEPTRESKAKWDVAYIDQIDEEKRRSDTSEYLPGLGFSEFHAGLCENIVKYWSLPGSHIVDPFMGRATRAVVSTTLNRTYEGYEISPSTHKRVTEHMKEIGLSASLHLDDGTQLKHTADATVDLVMTCPPYWNIEKYEDVDAQLSSTESYDEFMQMITVCGKNIARVLKPGAFCVWVCADFRDWSGKNKFYPFHSDTINTFTKDAGLLFHDIVIIKNNSPFAALQAGKVAAKRYTSKVHEYVLVFRKEGEYVVPEHCTLNPINENAEKFFEF